MFYVLYICIYKRIKLRKNILIYFYILHNIFTTHTQSVNVLHDVIKIYRKT